MAGDSQLRYIQQMKRQQTGGSKTTVESIEFQRRLQASIYDQLQSVIDQCQDKYEDAWIKDDVLLIKKELFLSIQKLYLQDIDSDEAAEKLSNNKVITRAQFQEKFNEFFSADKPERVKRYKLIVDDAVCSVLNNVFSQCNLESKSKGDKFLLQAPPEVQKQKKTEEEKTQKQIEKDTQLMDGFANLIKTF